VIDSPDLARTSLIIARPIPRPAVLHCWLQVNCGGLTGYAFGPLSDSSDPYGNRFYINIRTVPLKGTGLATVVTSLSLLLIGK